MRIAQIVCAWPPYSGGIGNSAYEIERLLKDKHEVMSFTPTTLTPWLKYGHGAFLPQLLWRLRKFDYIYLHYPFFGTAEIVWLFGLIYRKKKIIIHYHMDVKSFSMLSRILSFPSLLIRRSLLKRADLIITASLDYIQHSKIKGLYQTNPEKFREIPFGIDLGKYKPKLINQPTNNKLIAKTKDIIHHVNEKYIKKNRLDLLFVGALDKAHYFKGIEILLKSLVILPSRNWRLQIIGDGNLKEKYIDLTKELKIDKQVEFTGKLIDKDLIRSMQAADLLILPSINGNEAFGLVLIEAMACGLPVIASDLPGVRRVFANYQQGLLVGPNSADDLSQKLDFIINNEELRREMARSARVLAEKKYDINIMKEELEKIFE